MLSGRFCSFVIVALSVYLSFCSLNLLFVVFLHSSTCNIFGDSGFISRKTFPRLDARHGERWNIAGVDQLVLGPWPPACNHSTSNVYPMAPRSRTAPTPFDVLSYKSPTSMRIDVDQSEQCSARTSTSSTHRRRWSLTPSRACA